MANGFAGKILILHLDKETYETVPTSKYEEWIGGHGMATALFWDYCEDKTITDLLTQRTCALWQRPLLRARQPPRVAAVPKWWQLVRRGILLPGLRARTWVDVSDR